MQHDRRPLSELAQEGEKALEDPCLHPVRPGERAVVFASRCPELRHQATQLGRRRRAQAAQVDVAELTAREDRREPPQRFDERGERQAAAITQADAPTLEDEGTVVARPIGHLRDEPRLADPGVAADEHDRGVARGGARDGLGQVQELGVATDELRARDACRHALHGR